MLTQPAEYDYDDAYDGYGFSTAYDEDDAADDDDILDTLLRVTNAAGKIGLEAAQVGMKHGRKVVGKMKRKVPEVVVNMKERMSSYSFD